MQNRIGNFRFIALVFPAQTVKKQIAVYTRGGVEGVSLVDTAKRGVPCQVRSRVDAENLQQGRSLYEDYCGLIGDNPVDVVQDDVPLNSDNVRFAVLDVQLLVLKRITGAVGGLNDPSNAWLECDWTLLPVSNTPAPE